MLFKLILLRPSLWRAHDACSRLRPPGGCVVVSHWLSSLSTSSRVESAGCLWERALFKLIWLRPSLWRAHDACSLLRPLG